MRNTHQQPIRRAGLTVWIDYAHANKPVLWSDGEFDDYGHEITHATPYQSADMPRDQGAAWEMINDWLSHQQG